MLEISKGDGFKEEYIEDGCIKGWTRIMKDEAMNSSGGWKGRAEEEKTG